MSDFTIQPIPKTCPIERGAVALIGSILSAAPCYVLWKDRQEIVIQAPTNAHLTSVDLNDEHGQWRWMCKARPTFANYLEIIQTLLPEVEFGQSNRMFLLKSRKTNQYYLKSSPMTFEAISCPLWATFIPEDEVEITVWGVCADRRGKWKDKYVDVIYAWEPSELYALNQAMWGYRYLQASGLDLTYEVYGHLVDKDESVIGLVSEAAWGRPVKPEDRTLVFKAIAELQLSNCLYTGCLLNRFLIAGSKVRLIDLSCIQYYSDKQQLDDLAQSSHWKDLERLFEELKSEPFGCYRNLPLRFTSTYKNLDFIPPLPRCRPDLALGGIVLYPGFFRTYGVKPWEGYEMIEEPEGDEPMSSAIILRRKAGNRSTRRLITAAASSDVDNSVSIVRRPEVDPRPIDTEFHRRRLQFPYPPNRPNHQPERAGRPKLFSRSEDTASTSSVRVSGSLQRFF